MMIKKFLSLDYESNEIIKSLSDILECPLSSVFEDAINEFYDRGYLKIINIRFKTCKKRTLYISYDSNAKYYEMATRYNISFSTLCNFVLKSFSKRSLIKMNIERKINISDKGLRLLKNIKINSVRTTSKIFEDILHDFHKYRFDVEYPEDVKKELTASRSVLQEPNGITVYLSKKYCELLDNEYCEHISEILISYPTIKKYIESIKED